MPTMTVTNPVFVVTDDNSDYRLFVYESMDKPGQLTVKQTDGEGYSMEFSLDEEEVPELKKFLAEHWHYDPDAKKELSASGLEKAVAQYIKNMDRGVQERILSPAADLAVEVITADNRIGPAGIVFSDPVSGNTLTFTPQMVIDLKEFLDQLVSTSIEGYIG